MDCKLCYCKLIWYTDRVLHVQVLTEDTEGIRSGRCLQSDQIHLAIQLIRQTFPQQQGLLCTLLLYKPDKLPRLPPDSIQIHHVAVGSVRGTVGPIPNFMIASTMGGLKVTLHLNFGPCTWWRLFGGESAKSAAAAAMGNRLWLVCCCLCTLSGNWGIPYSHQI